MPLGIPLSTFLRWPQGDQDAALAYREHEARRCGTCKTHPADYDPDAGGRRHAWHPTVEVCEGCAATERGQETYGTDLAQHGARLVLTTAPPRPPQRAEDPEPDGDAGPDTEEGTPS